MGEPRGTEDQAFYATPEMRAAVRSQIVVEGRLGSEEIAAALGLRHGTVVRVLQRFAAVGALALEPSPTGSITAVEVVPDSPSARFRDLSVPLW